MRRRRADEPPWRKVVVHAPIDEAAADDRARAESQRHDVPERLPNESTTTFSSKSVSGPVSKEMRRELARRDACEPRALALSFVTTFASCRTDGWTESSSKRRHGARQPHEQRGRDGESFRRSHRPDRTTNDSGSHTPAGAGDHARAAAQRAQDHAKSSTWNALHRSRAAPRLRVERIRVMEKVIRK